MVMYYPRLVYKLPAVVEWARSSAPDLFVFDEAAFKKLAKKRGAVPPELAHEEKVPTAVIKDLSGITAGQQDVDGVVAA
jgi:hypothetical protein